MHRIVISICGGSGAGKSQLAKQLVAHLGADSCSRVPTDYYLLPGAAAEPLAYDWHLLAQTLALPDDAECTTPDFDFDHCTRLALSGGRLFYLRPVMVIDGMLPYPRADYIFLLKTPEDERQRRITARDAIWQTRVIDCWNQNENTLDSLAVSMYHYSMVLDGLEPVETNSQRIVEFLREKGIVHR